MDQAEEGESPANRPPVGSKARSLRVLKPVAPSTVHDPVDGSTRASTWDGAWACETMM